VSPSDDIPVAFLLLCDKEMSCHQSFEELNDVSSAQELFAITKKLSLASDEEWRQ
jgi:hypothetical protein